MPFLNEEVARDFRCLYTIKQKIFYLEHNMLLFYPDIITIHLDLHAVRRAKNFADNVTPTVNYTDSFQTNIAKIKDDHFVSKLGEEAATLALSSFGKVEGPDYTIYAANEKSWADDLYINDIGIAVKTQRRTSALKYTLSWTFQLSGRVDPILNKPDAWVIFVEYDDMQPYLCNVYPPFQMKELELGEPKLAYLAGKKKVVYAGSLQLPKLSAPLN